MDELKKARVVERRRKLKELQDEARRDAPRQRSKLQASTRGVRVRLKG